MYSNIVVEQKKNNKTIYKVKDVDINTLPKKYVYRAFKRAFDIVSCSLALIVLAIPMLIIAIVIHVDSPGPIFYSQERLGLHGKAFNVYKFRSMIVDAEAEGAQWAKEDDPRITKVGGFLRKSRLDEIPQFWNVIKGDMTLIGPRPERPVFYYEFEDFVPGFKQRLLVKPGISGLAQVCGGYDLTPQEKIVYDVYYIEHRSLALDIKIIFKTLVTIFSHDGAR